MDKNIGALLREGAYTIHVRFFSLPYSKQPEPMTLLSIGEEPVLNLSAKTYTYVTDIVGMKAGDYVVVSAQGVLQVAVVSSVDEELDIEPNSDIQYRWVVSKVDMEYYRSLQQQLAELNKVLATQYVKNTRRSFRNTFLSGADEETQLRIKQLTGVQDAKE